MLGICEQFTNTACLTNIIPFPFQKNLNSQTIPIPTCKDAGSQIYLCSCLQGK